MNRSADSSTLSPGATSESAPASDVMPGDVDIETERARDRAAYEKFLKIPVRHITDGQGKGNPTLII